MILTHRTAIYLRLSLGTGFSLGEGILVNTTTLGLSLGSKITFKLTKQRMIDTTVGCYLYKDGLSARVFGYIPTYKLHQELEIYCIVGRKKSCHRSCLARVET